MSGSMRRAAFGLALLAATVTAAHAFLRKPVRLSNTQPEMWMSSTKLIEALGLDSETHTVRTEDGYILTVHRAGHGRAKNGTATPLLMGHGGGSSDEQWLLRSKDNLVVMLTELGFDVWLTNFRGSFYSRKHETLHTKSHEFWDFSWHENGVSDQSALIDYVLMVTGQRSLLVLSYSMSCAAQVVLLAERPEYNAKVRASVLIAPPVYMANPPGLLGALGNFFKNPSVREAAARNLANNVVPWLDHPSPQACYERVGPRDAKMEPHCDRVMRFAVGQHREPIDKEQLQLMWYHFPAGISYRQLFHFLQVVGTGGRFVKYDFGPERNMHKYGSTCPPEYNLSRIDSPLYLHYSSGDGVVNYKDVEEFARDLPPGVLRRLRKAPVEVFSHIDYLVAKDAYDLAYREVIQDLLKHVN